MQWLNRQNKTRVAGTAWLRGGGPSTFVLEAATNASRSPPSGPNKT